jgi:hypothetical protein
MGKALWFTCGWLALGPAAWAQDKTARSYPFVDLGFSSGIYAVPSSAVKEDLGGDVSFFQMETRLTLQTTGKDLYSYLWRCPRWTLGYSGTYLNNDTILGTPNAIFLGIDVPFSRYEPGRKWTFSYMLAGGLSYNFRPNSATDNPWNLMIGSYNNVYVEVGFYSHYNLGRLFDVDAGVSFTHYSNGANNMPNRGLNMVGAKVRLRHNLRREEVPKVMTRTLEPWEVRRQWTIQMGYGSKQREILGEVNYNNFTLSVYYEHWQYRKGRWVGGLELFYDASVMPYGQVNPQLAFRATNPWLVGLFAGYHAVYNRWTFLTGLGYHIYQGTTLDPGLYQRFGLRYRIHHGLYAGVSLKAKDFGAANFVEWSLGYTLF